MQVTKTKASLAATVVAALGIAGGTQLSSKPQQPATPPIKGAMHKVVDGDKVQYTVIGESPAATLEIPVSPSYPHGMKVQVDNPLRVTVSKHAKVTSKSGSVQFIEAGSTIEIGE
jgi:hypothetical protein